MLSMLTLFKCFFVFVAVDAALIVKRQQDGFFEASGDDPELRECQDGFVTFRNTFLRGVKEPFFKTYNDSTVEDCKLRCCLESVFSCQSFSYFPLLNICYVMNVSKSASAASLDSFKGWHHFHRLTPTELPADTYRSTTSNSEANTLGNIRAASPTDTSQDPSPIVGNSTVMSENTPPTQSKFTSPSNDVTNILGNLRAAPPTDISQDPSTMVGNSTVITENTPPTQSKFTSPINDVTNLLGNFRAAPPTGTNQDYSPAVGISTIVPIHTSTSPTQSEFTSPTNDVKTFSSASQSKLKDSSVMNVLLRTTHSNGVQMLPDPTTIQYGERLLEIKTIDNILPQSSIARDASTRYFAPTTNTNGVICDKACRNGICVFKTSKDDELTLTCTCDAGFKGDLCENKNNPAKLAGFPPYIIVVVILGILLLLLFIIILVVYLLYRKKTGKYRVKKQRERWSKRSRQTRKRQKESLDCVGTRSPIGSELSAPGSVNSNTTRSTNTLPV